MITHSRGTSSSFLHHQHLQVLLYRPPRPIKPDLLNPFNTPTMSTQTLLPNQSSLPSTNSTSSYWHQNPSQHLLNHRTTSTLPSSSPIVIVGSGITAAFAARELVLAGKDVLMLEAREACWGATGRVSFCAFYPFLLKTKHVDGT